MLSAKPQVYYENGYIIIRQVLVCGQRPDINVFFNNKAVPRSSKFVTDVIQDDLSHVVTFKIKDVSILAL